MKFISILITSGALLFSNTIAAQLVDLGSPYNKQSGLISQAKQQPQVSVVMQNWSLTTENVKALLSAKVGQSIELDNPPRPENDLQSDSPATASALKLKRYELYAPGAQILVIEDGILREIPRPSLHAFASANDDMGLLVNIETGSVTGLYQLRGNRMEITGDLKTGLEFEPLIFSDGTDGSTYQCATTMADQAGDPFADLAEALSSRSAEITAVNTPAYQTTIAIDTDMEWMAGKSNNVNTALNYINSMFVNMNVFMERDLSLRLLIGTTYLRVNADPISPQADIRDYLYDFGDYWRTEQTTVERDFTMLLSGENIGSNSFSGIAWLNQYCQDGFPGNTGSGIVTIGSYSVNRIGANASVGFISQFVGHELGHNLGSPHTHCYNPTVDTCFNAEAGCYEGSVSCPAGGTGTIMSYCHFGGTNGANCGLSDSEFHPTVSGLIGSRITANSPSCIATLAASDIVFEDGFE